MLRSDVYDLAQRSVSAGISERLDAFAKEIRSILTAVAHYGNLGGSLVRTVSNAAFEEGRARMDIASTELERATRSKGVRHYPALAKDLGEALDRLSRDRCDDVVMRGTEAIRSIPNTDQAVGAFESGIQVVIATRLNQGRTNLEHFAEEIGTGERERSREQRIKLRQAVAVAAIGAVIGSALTLLVQWFAHVAHI